MTEAKIEQGFDASDPAQVADRKTAAGRRAKAFKDVVTGLMATASGRAWMCDLLEQCHIFQTSFAGDSMRLAFNEGERNVGLRLLAQVMAASPDAWVLMMKEAKE
jgi:hypothetical protein